MLKNLIDNSDYVNDMCSDEEIGNICFDKQIMNRIFAYKRRKNFMHFLVENGFELFGQKLLQESEHILFDIHDINANVMSFL
jgi:hypothetical protein